MGVVQPEMTRNHLNRVVMYAAPVVKALKG